MRKKHLFNYCVTNGIVDVVCWIGVVRLRCVGFGVVGRVTFSVWVTCAA